MENLEKKVKKRFNLQGALNAFTNYGNKVQLQGDSKKSYQRLQGNEDQLDVFKERVIHVKGDLYVKIEYGDSQPSVEDVVPKNIRTVDVSFLEKQIDGKFKNISFDELDLKKYGIKEEDLNIVVQADKRLGNLLKATKQTQKRLRDSGVYSESYKQSVGDLVNDGNDLGIFINDNVYVKIKYNDKTLDSASVYVKQEDGNFKECNFDEVDFDALEVNTDNLSSDFVEPVQNFIELVMVMKSLRQRFKDANEYETIASENKGKVCTVKDDENKVNWKVGFGKKKGISDYIYFSPEPMEDKAIQLPYTP